jgi:mannose/cellobiose epimerase-like protein (N-acyl-D-glucosamine 2-epimerase family)
MWEFVDDDGHPYLDDGRILRCDPGHACEFVGLSMKLLRVAEQRGVINHVAPARLAGYRAILPEVLARNFANGFSAGGIGIVKAVNLLTREIIHTDMPWWSLPETMRAAAEVGRVISTTGAMRLREAEKHASPLRVEAWHPTEIGRLCANAFAAGYVRPEVHLMAYQTLGADGRPVDAIPGMPDADPGYHTGLSLIDCLDLWGNP